MFLRYKGARTEFVLTMAWLTAGPYYVDGPGDVVEVLDADGITLLEEGPGMFEKVNGFEDSTYDMGEAEPEVEEETSAVEEEQPEEEQPDTVTFPCEECSKVYATKSGLNRHIKATHR